MNEVVLYEKEGPLGLITINRPEVRNSLNLEVFSALSEVLDKISIDEEIRVVVVTGAGSVFVAGADINELLGYQMMNGWAASRFHQSVFNKLEKLGKPSIAAISGFALGGGLELALSCTFRITSINAKLGFPELGLGIIPGFGGTERLFRCVGYAKAAEMLLFRSIVSGEEAYRIGLVNKVTSEDSVMTGAKDMAQNLSALSPVAVRLELELLLEAQGAGLDKGMALESALGALAVASDEAKELLGRFLSKERRK